MEFISLIGIVAVLLIFAVLCFRCIPATVSAPLLCVIIWGTGVLANSGQTFGDMTSIFSAGVASAMQRYLLLFMLSALFGRIIGDTGIAYALGTCCGNFIEKAPPKYRRFLAVLMVPMINAIFTYCGVSLFVVVFAVVTIVRDLFKRLDVPWHLYSMSIIGSSTITASMLPGSPALANLTPITYLGTDAMAAPVLSIVLSVVSVALSMTYMTFAVRRTEKKGEGFFPTGEAISQANFAAGDDIQIRLGPAVALLFLPVIFMNIVGLTVEASLGLSDAILFLVYRKWLVKSSFIKCLSEGMQSGIGPAVSLGIMMGFANVLTKAPGFQPVLEAIQSIPGPEHVQLVVMVGVTSFLLGNSNVAIDVSLSRMGTDFIAASGITAEAVHRLASLAGMSGAAPHSSALCNSIMVARMNHRMAYPHYFVLGPVNTIILCILACWLVSMGLVF